MFTNFLQWVKTHKLVLLLSLIVFYLFSQRFTSKMVFNTGIEDSLSMRSYGDGGSAKEMGSVGIGIQDRAVAPSMGVQTVPSDMDYTPAPDVVNRLVVQNSYLSLLVSDVTDVRKKIIEHARAQGGYMVNSETSNPQDAPTASVTVRVPSEKLESSLEIYRSWGIKVVSENLMGSDVTDQYMDLDARLVTLETTKLSMEKILAQAQEISDITKITREIISIQSQIDSIKGMQKSLEENAALAKVTIYLSTDEIALPYAPSETFRPQVIFKTAVRSLVVHMRQTASAIIWLAVYSIVWVPVLLIVYLLNKRFSKKLQK